MCTFLLIIWHIWFCVKRLAQVVSGGESSWVRGPWCKDRPWDQIRRRQGAPDECSIQARYARSDILSDWDWIWNFILFQPWRGYFSWHIWWEEDWGAEYEEGKEKNENKDQELGSVSPFHLQSGLVFHTLVREDSSRRGYIQKARVPGVQTPPFFLFSTKF